MSRLTILVALTACSDGGTVQVKDDPDDTGTPEPTTDTPPPTPTTWDTGDTGATTDVDLVVDALDWRVHDTVGSLLVVSWNQTATADVHIEYSVDPGEWMSSPVQRREAGEHEQILVGVPYAHDAVWRVVAERAGDDPVVVDGDTATTGPLPQGIPRPIVTVSEPTRWLADGKWLLTSINQFDGGWTGGVYWTFILDRAGRYVWAHRAPDNHWTLFASIARSGDHFLWDESTYWSDFGDGEQSKVHRTWLDEEIEVIDTPGLHHAWIELADGTLVWGSKAHGGVEALVEKGPTQPDETVLWTCADDWDGGVRFGQCESNGLFHQESTDSFLYSFYTNNSLVEVDHATGETLWWAGQVRDGYVFDPPDSQFSWQHGVSYTATGTLLLSSEWDNHRTEPTRTWLMEYDVDQVDGSLTLLWANSCNARADTNGQAWRLANDNTLHICGSAGVLREVEAGTGEDVWRVDWQDDHLLGHGQYLSDLYPLLKPVEAKP